jgi:hypothetical protein
MSGPALDECLYGVVLDAAGSEDTFDFGFSHVAPAVRVIGPNTASKTVGNQNHRRLAALSQS